MHPYHDYLTVNDAAAFLGVSGATLRNWDRSGKLKAFRHPANGYRLYSMEDLIAFREGAPPGGPEAARPHQR